MPVNRPTPGKNMDRGARIHGGVFVSGSIISLTASRHVVDAFVSPPGTEADPHIPCLHAVISRSSEEEGRFPPLSR